ncbi:DUF4345 domain-containing protein [Sphingomonas sp.]|uniref:DUF4345 domain-containing protein n=1 Tax=Sphingomonas sp. TaxID=28214 RepID=UPI003B3A4B63
MDRTESHHPARGLIVVLRLLTLLPFATGAGDLLAGTTLLQQAGASLPDVAARDATLNNQIAFWGTMWLGYGVLLWWATRDLAGRAPVARFLIAALFVSGLARAYSSVRYGLPAMPLVAAMVLELFLSPILYWWLSRTFPQRSVPVQG